MWEQISAISVDYCFSSMFTLYFSICGFLFLNMISFWNNVRCSSLFWILRRNFFSGWYFFPLSFWREATHTGQDSWFSSSAELIYLFLLLYYNKILTFLKHLLLDSSSYLPLLCVRCMALKVKAQVLWSSILISQCQLDSLALCLHYDFCFWGFLTYQFSNSFENIFKIFSSSFFQKEDCSGYLVCQVAGNERLSWFLNNFFFLLACDLTNFSHPFAFLSLFVGSSFSAHLPKVNVSLYSILYPFLICLENTFCSRLSQSALHWLCRANLGRPQVMQCLAKSIFEALDPCV